MDHCLHPVLKNELLQQAPNQLAIDALESGKIIYLPQHPFALQITEHVLLADTILAPKHKNISYNHLTQKLGGYTTTQPSLPAMLQGFMHRYAEFAKQQIDTLLPNYSKALIWGRTSYRPAEIKGRITSKRKDDTRVHVDSFAATPVNGLRILRVFCNINPHGQPRVWHVGEPFSEVLSAFAHRIPPYSKLKAKLLQRVKLTKTLRSSYDHHMLHLHDQMKLDEKYQQTLKKQRVDFPSDSTWIVFTDHVSHAALSGQFLLEQTFYLPVEAMGNPELSPLMQWNLIPKQRP